jgi:hypothetical protein
MVTCIEGLDSANIWHKKTRSVLKSQGVVQQTLEAFYRRKQHLTQDYIQQIFPLLMDCSEFESQYP